MTAPSREQTFSRFGVVDAGSVVSVGCVGRLCRSAEVVAVMVIGMVIKDAWAVVAALADPETLYVFGVIAMRTTKVGKRESDRVTSMPYVTPFGLMRETSLSREVVEESAARLKRAGLLEVLVDDERGYESWRVSEGALAAAATETSV